MMTPAQYDRLERIARLLCKEDKTRTLNSRKQLAKLREMLEARPNSETAADKDPQDNYPSGHQSEEG